MAGSQSKDGEYENRVQIVELAMMKTNQVPPSMRTGMSGASSMNQTKMSRTNYGNLISDGYNQPRQDIHVDAVSLNHQ